MEAEHLARLLLEQVTVDRIRAHHDDLLLQRRALGGGQRILLFRRLDLAVERDEAQVTPFPRDQVITEVEGQTDPDHGDQVLAENVTLFDESLHLSNESQTILQVKQYREKNQRLVWVHSGNKPPKRFF